MHFSLVRFNPADGPPSHGLDDVILPLFYALKSLGYRTEIRLDSVNPRSRNIVFGSCLAPRKIGRMLPPGSIVFNLEQLGGDSKWMNRDYQAHLREFPVWDYSAANMAVLEGLGARAAHVPPGYVPEMTRLRRDCPRDVDVLFYGLINDRRHAIIKALHDAGLKVLATQEAFGNLRDALLARARLVLNVHYYLPAKLEMVRLGYVFANCRAVASERRPDTEIPPGLEEACAFYDYEDLVDGVRELLADEQAREKQEDAAFAVFAARPLARTLEGLVGRRAAPAGGLAGSAEGGVEGPSLQEWLITGDVGG